jgi:hypothetical protein
MKEKIREESINGKKKGNESKQIKRKNGVFPDTGK